MDSSSFKIKSLISLEDDISKRVSDKTNESDDAEIYLNKIYEKSLKFQQKFKATHDMEKRFLKDRYKTNYAYMRSMLWDGIIKDLPIKEYYVEVNLKKIKLLGGKRNKIIKLHQIFSETVSQHPKILITGDPGCGKTALCKKLAYDWATNETPNHYLSNFDFVVIVTLREINERSIKDVILNIIKRPKTKIENMLVILDGFDEIDNKYKVEKFIYKDYFYISETMTIIITSRPHGIEELRQNVDTHLSLEEFSPEQQQKYIEMVSDSKITENSISKLLESKDVYHKIAKYPLFLYWMCFNYITLQNTTSTKIYTDLFHILFQRYKRKYSWNRSKHFCDQNWLIILGEFLYSFRKLRFTYEDFKLKIPPKEKRKFILDIIKVHSFDIDKGMFYYELIDTSFRDFLIASYLFTNIENIEQLSCNYQQLIFLLGHFSNKPFPENFLKYLNEIIISASSFRNAFKEIKDEINQESFCSNIKILIHQNESNILQELITSLNIEKLFICFSDSLYDKNILDVIGIINKSVLQRTTDKPIHIYLFLQKCNSNDTEGCLSQENSSPSDITNFTKCINDLNAKYTNLKFSFCGVTNCDNSNHCTAIENHVEYFRMMKRPAETDKEFAGLQTKVNSDDQMDWIISAEQFEKIKPFIKLFPTDEPQSIFDRQNSIQLEMFRKKLKTHCRNIHSYMNLFYNHKKHVPMDKYFVDVSIKKTNLLGISKGKAVCLEDIFKKRNDRQTILLTGEPGYGKTTLCKKIAYDWGANEEENYLSDFDFLVFINASDLLEKTPSQIITSTILYNTEIEFGCNLTFSNLNILVILDQFDEYLNKESILQFIEKDSVEISTRMTILISSRPHNADAIRKHIDNRYSIEGFSPEQQQKYIEIFLQEKNIKAKELVQQIIKNNFISNLAACPLTLNMLCSLYESKIIQIEKITDLYVELFSFLLVGNYEKNDQHDMLKDKKYFPGKDLLVEVGGLFLSYPIKDVILKETSVESYIFLLKSLNIFTIHSVSKNGEIYFDIVHKTFYEFILALYVHKYGKYNDSSLIISNETLMFILGLIDDNAIPEDLINVLKYRTFSSQFLMQIKNELNEENWKIVCANVNLTFDHEYMESFKEPSNLYSFRKFVLQIPQEQKSYKIIEETLIDIFKQYNDVNEVKIFLFPDLRISSKAFEYFDFREEIGKIVDLISLEKNQNKKIYFSGIYWSENQTYYMIEDIINDYEIFPQNVISELNMGDVKKIVGLLIKNANENRFVLLITLEKYEIVKDHVKFSLLLS